MQLLHLEDSPTDAELIALLLRREWPKCRIRQVANGSDYCAALAADRFDFILSDYTVPGFDGLAALAVARERFPEVPFLFLSGTIGEERAVEALKRGASDYVIKDRPTRLVPAIRQAMALVDEAGRRRRTEAALRENEKRFRQITENVVELIALLDLDGRRLYANPAYRELLGERAVEVGGDAFAEVHPEDMSRARAAFARAIATGETQQAEYRLRMRARGQWPHRERGVGFPRCDGPARSRGAVARAGRAARCLATGSTNSVSASIPCASPARART